MARRRAREFALQALYLADMEREETEAIDGAKALQKLWAGQLDEAGLEIKPAEAEEMKFAQRIVDGVTAHGADVDGLIERASENWRLSRMPLVDRNILRIAAYELLACEDVPASVSINEAVELAKRFGEKDSRAFVNGLLDRIAAETGRGGRRHKG